MRKRETVNVNDIMDEVHEVDIVDIVPQDRTREEGKIGNLLFDAEVEMIGTFNRDKNKLLATFDKGYHLIDHRDFLATISDHFGEEFEGSYYIGEDSESLYVYIYPEDMKQLIKDPRDGTEEWINLGLRLANSYDGSTALRVESVGIREVCSNGMWAQTFAKRGYQRHTKKSNLNEFSVAISKVLEADFDDIVMTYQDAMKEEIKSVSVFLKEVYGQRHKALQKYLYDRVKGRDVVTKWDIYNHVTRGLTHGFREEQGSTMDANSYSELTLENLHKVSNRVLTVDLNDIDWSKDITLAGEK